MGNISAHIAARRDTIYKENTELAALEELAERFADLSATQAHHWGSMLVAPSVNALADKVRFVEGCSSCGPDAPLQARPFLEAEAGRRVYTESSYVVGHPNYCGDGFHPEHGWRDKMLADGISGNAIAAVEKYLQENPPEDSPEDSDESPGQAFG